MHTLYVYLRIFLIEKIEQEKIPQLFWKIYYNFFQKLTSYKMTLHFAFFRVFLLFFMLLLIISDIFLVLSLHFIPAVIWISVSILSCLDFFFSFALHMGYTFNSLFLIWLSFPLEFYCLILHFEVRKGKGIHASYKLRIYTQLCIFFFYYFKVLIWWTHASCCMKYSFLQQILLYVGISPYLH